MSTPPFETKSSRCWRPAQPMPGRMSSVWAQVPILGSRSNLRRFAGVWSIWALGVSGVIPGEYSGWNYGLITGGFGGMLVATLVIVVMYLGLCFSLAEMTS